MIDVDGPAYEYEKNLAMLVAQALNNVEYTSATE